MPVTFSLTEKGDAFYKELEATWNELANAVKALSDAEQEHTSNASFNSPEQPDSQ